MLWPKIIEEDKRVLCQLLNKLHIPNVVDDYKICSLKLLIDHLRTVRGLCRYWSYRLTYTDSDGPWRTQSVFQLWGSSKQPSARNSRSNLSTSAKKSSGSSKIWMNYLSSWIVSYLWMMMMMILSLQNIQGEARSGELYVIGKNDFCILSGSMQTIWKCDYYDHDWRGESSWFTPSRPEEKHAKLEVRPRLFSWILFLTIF